jgi:hypothetical protein
MTEPRVPWPTTPALDAALADLWAATAKPVDLAASARWQAHRAAALAERLCPLDGQPLDSCRHYWYGDSVTDRGGSG